MTIALREKTSLGEVTGTRRWYSRIIAKGSGSSGFYTEEALRDSGPAAFPEGTKINADHQSFEEYLNQPAGSVQSLIGVVVSTPEYLDDGEDYPGLYAEVEFSDTWAPFIEQFAQYMGLSINANGYGEDTTEEGQRIVEGFIPSVLNTVDLVTEPGAKGKLIKALESYGIIETKTVSSSTDKESKPMDEKDVKAIADAVSEALAPTFSAITEALKPVEEVVPEPVEGPDVAAVTEAMIDSGLPKAARDQVYKAVENGAELTESIEGMKNLAEAFKVEATEDAGRIQESGGKAPARVTKWSI